MMIEFKPITICDKALIESFTLDSTIQNCDLAFANMYCWQPVFGSEWAIVDGFLVIRFRLEGGSTYGYMQPIGHDGQRDISTLTPILAADAHANGHRLTIVGLDTEGHDSLTELQSDSYALYSDRDNEDYIYCRHELSSLRGKRLQAKRNHINQFESRFDYRYETLEAHHFAQCYELFESWVQSIGGESLSTRRERMALDRAFASYDKLALRGGVIIVDEKVVAFSYGSPINNSTFCIHTEKGDTSYVGVYALINNRFASSLPPQFTHINREEDMGLEGLRRAKLSYYPTRLLPKYSAIYLHSDESECKRLWQETFGDSNAFIDDFIINHYSRSNMLSVVDVGYKHLSMLQMIPFGSAIGRCAYIYGVATSLECRNKGYATKLLLEAIEKAKEEGFVAIILIAAEESLKQFYGRYGFREECLLRFEALHNFDFGSGSAELDVAQAIKLKPNIEFPSLLTLVEER